MKATTSSLSKLARAYAVHLTTFKKWLSAYPEIKLDKNKRILTPKQVQLIYDLIGEP